MRRVLALAYNFPPIGGGGVQRTLKFVQHLPEFGWEPIVLTGSASPSGRWAPADPSLAAEVPDDLEIVRLPGEPGPGGPGRRRLERWLALDNGFQRWWVEGSVKLGASVQGADVVYASMSPFASGEAAARIARTLGCPWVADLRDPWALDEVAVHPTRLHRAHERKRMRRLLSQADIVIMNTPEAARRVAESFPEIDRARIRTIPNGFDEHDFAAPEPRRADASFRIVHAGYLHTELGHRLRRARRARRLLGGWPADVDLLTRSHVNLLEAVRQVIQAGDSGGTPIDVHLAGVSSGYDLAAGAGEFVRYHGYLPHTDAVELVRSADLLFLPMHDLPPGTRATIVPGKTYEYLASGRPILAALPDGDARDLLEQVGSVYLCRPTDYGEMARIITRLVDAFRIVGRAPTRRTELVGTYERRLLTARLAATFNSISLSSDVAKWPRDRASV